MKLLSAVLFGLSMTTCTCFAAPSFDCVPECRIEGPKAKKDDRTSVSKLRCKCDGECECSSGACRCRKRK